MSRPLSVDQMNARAIANWKREGLMTNATEAFQRAAAQPRPRGGDLEILEEVTMVEIPRGERGEVLRVTFTKARTGQGKEVAWHSIREFYQAEDGTMRPGKKGITIRGRELATVAQALTKAASGGQHP